VKEGGIKASEWQSKKKERAGSLIAGRGEWNQEQSNGAVLALKVKLWGSVSKINNNEERAGRGRKKIPPGNSQWITKSSKVSAKKAKG